jgi:hypothetical protein
MSQRASCSWPERCLPPFSRQDVGVELVDPQAGHRVAIERRDPAPARLPHDHVGHDVAHVARAEGPTRLGIEGEDEGADLAQVVLRDA